MIAWPVLFLICSAVGRTASPPLVQAPFAATNVVDTGYSQFEGQIIDSIEIDNRNIYDTREQKYTRFPFQTINQVHMKTKQAVIRRELLFKKDDTLKSELIEESARNIRHQLSVYNAWIEVERTDDDKVLVRVVTVDEWSLTTSLSITKNGGEVDYRVGVHENNLLGNNQSMSFDYFVENREAEDETLSDKDQKFIVWSFGDPRLLGWKQSLFLGYSNNRRNSYSTVSMGQPYYDLNQKWRYELSLINIEGRRDFYTDGIIVAEADYLADGATLGVSRRFGPYHKKLRLNFQYNYHREKALQQREIDHSENSVVFPSDSIYHELALSTRGSVYDFVKLQRIDGVGFTEDFITGISLLIGASRANDPDFKSYRYHRLYGELSRQWYTRGHLVGIQLSNSYYFNGNKEIRNQWGADLSFYNNGLDFFTFALNGSFISDVFSSGQENLLIGGSSGLRGFDNFFRTGNRKAVVNMEGRFFPNIEFLSAILGSVLFLDLGRTWKENESVSFDHFLIGGGAGLRIYLPRLGRKRVIRLDFGYSQQNGWQVSLGTNQYFRAPLSGFSLTNL